MHADTKANTEMTNEEMLFGLTLLPGPDLLTPNRLEDPPGSGVYYRADTVVRIVRQEIKNLQAMYDAQCLATDEWAEKHHAEVERKGDAALLARIAELERALGTVNVRMAEKACEITKLRSEKSRRQKFCWMLWRQAHEGAQLEKNDGQES